MANSLYLPIFPFIETHEFFWHGISLWLVQVICLGVNPHSQSIHWNIRVRNRGDLDAAQTLFSTNYSIKSVISSISVKILNHRAAMKRKIYSILARASAKV